MSPDDALDRGASGLVFFEQFLPAARRIGIEHREYADYSAAFDAERGLDVHALEEDAEAARAIASTAQAATEDHRTDVNTLSSAWWDGAGPDAVAFAGTIRDRGDDTAAQLSAVADALGELPDTLRQAVQTKAFEVASLHQTTVAGYTAHQIATLVDIGEVAAGSSGYLVERLMTDAATWFPKIASAIAAHELAGRNGVEPCGRALDSPELCAAVAQIARDWLRDSFAPCYTRTRTLFDDACMQCAATVRAAYCAVSDEAEKVATDAYPAPSGWGPVPAPTPQQAPAAPPPPAPGSSYTPSPGPPAQSSLSPTLQPGPNAQPHYVARPDYGPPPGPSTVPGQIPGYGYGGLQGFHEGEFPGAHRLGDLGDLGGPMGSLRTLLGEVSSLVEPVIEDVVSALTIDDDSVGDAEPVDEEPSSEVEGPPPGTDESRGDEKSLELKSDGKTWTLAVDDDGKGISLQVDDGLGESTRYAIEMGPDGIPRIVVDSDTPSDDVAGEEPGCDTASSPQNAVETMSDTDPAPAESPGPSSPESPADPPAVETPDNDVHDAQSGEPELASVSPEGMSPDSAPSESVTPENVSSERSETVSGDPAELTVNSQVPGDGVGPESGDTGAELAEAGPLENVDR